MVDKSRETDPSDRQVGKHREPHNTTAGQIRQPDRQTQTEGPADTQDSLAYISASSMGSDRQFGGQTDSLVVRQTVWWSDRQVGGQTDR